jgi:endonuclease VIII
MPKDPETHYVADLLGAALAGKILREVRFASAAPTPYAAGLRGPYIVAFQARGKAVLSRFDNGLALFAHDSMNRARRVWRGAPCACRLLE